MTTRGSRPRILLHLLLHLRVALLRAGGKRNTGGKLELPLIHQGAQFLAPFLHPARELDVMADCSNLEEGLY